MYRRYRQPQAACCDSQTATYTAVLPRSSDPQVNVILLELCTIVIKTDMSKGPHNVQEIAVNRPKQRGAAQSQCIATMQTTCKLC